MNAFDSKVIVHLCVRDDEDQYQRAELVFRSFAARLLAQELGAVLMRLSTDFPRENPAHVAARFSCRQFERPFVARA